MVSSYIQTIEDFFVYNFKKTLSSRPRHEQKTFNKDLKRFKLMVFHPYYMDDEYHVLFGFSDECEVLCSDKASSTKIYNQIKKHMYFSPKGDVFSLEQTLIIPTLNIDPLPLRKIPWDEAIEQPKLGDADFSYIEDSFIEFYGLENNKYTEYGKNKKSLSSFFNKNENKPDELELRIVWDDVDSGEKYGDIQVLIFWKNEFIGWIHRSGKWLESYSYSTIDATKWCDMMQTIFQKSEYSYINSMSGVSVHSMDSDVDDLMFIQGVSINNYSNDD